MNEGIANLYNGLLDILNTINGGSHLSSNSAGIKYLLGMFFTIYLFSIIKMRALVTMERKHIVALIGALLLFLRYLILFIFDWGYQIHLHEDEMIQFLLPPLTHFFYMMGLGCLAYYSLCHYEYYPGLLKKILWAIPTFMTAFFIYASIQWKSFFFLTNGEYYTCSVDWQSHLLLCVMSLYLTIVAMYKYNKDNHYLSAFWTVMFVKELVSFYYYFNHCEPIDTSIVFNAVQMWAIPLFTLHFVKAYVVRMSDCVICARKVMVK